MYVRNEYHISDALMQVYRDRIDRMEQDNELKKTKKKEWACLTRSFFFHPVYPVYPC
jgi:hypothetical protein